eukprot:TRINITY_DN23976_c0_g1_i1.p1 TRINITY_DN23976_c0_g1~~TRINITY_DN23976_c0_g1_i1.p1  ORF type:complete len:131 (-),score=38.53 TRINITY_DN23976_c0_g1_i1:25-417(-)
MEYKKAEGEVTPDDPEWVKKEKGAERAKKIEEEVRQRVGEVIPSGTHPINPDQEIDENIYAWRTTETHGGTTNTGEGILEQTKRVTANVATYITEKATAGIEKIKETVSKVQDTNAPPTNKENQYLPQQM